MRNGASDETIATAIARIWEQRTDRYSQLRGSNALPAADPRRAARRDVVHRRLTWLAQPIRASAATNITGVVLAGGRGSRMGGIDKGMQPFDGAPLALHVLRRLAPQAGAMLISANRSIDEYARIGEPFGAKVVTDALPDFPGPLAGIVAGDARGADAFVLTAPCDAPFVDANLAQTLADALVAHNADIATAVAVDDERPARPASRVRALARVARR